MEQNQVRTKAIKKLIFLVALTGIMLIMSTYAWFSTQKNVTISGLKGNVNVAEGLQISLDAQIWTNVIDFSSFTVDANTNIWTSPTYLTGADTTFQQPYTYGDGSTATNVTPIELLPASTTGTTGEGIGSTALKMYSGNITDSVKLDSIKEINELSTTENPGYFAFDVFLQNISGSATVEDILRIETNSSVTVNSGKEASGLQNTVRVAFALYDSSDADLIVDGTTTASEIIEGTKGTNISDVAIWEPNAYTADVTNDAVAHVPNIVASTTYLKLSSTDATTAGLTYNDFGTATSINGAAKLPTYALTASSIDAETISTALSLKGLKDTFDWATPAPGLEKQITLQTSTAGIGSNPIDLISIAKTEALTGTETDPDTTFTIPANEYVKMRVYVWIEGQDVDCTNHASLAGGVTVNIGITKGTESSASTDESGPYLPTGFSYVAGTDLDTGLVIEDTSGNQYVWIEVPQTDEVYPTAGVNVTAFSEDEYTKIENDLHTYTSTYRNGTSYSDVYAEDSDGNSATGLTSSEYTALKQKMLKSVYQNGGFYIGRYETGIIDSDRDYDLTDDTVFETEHPITETAVSQANAYPYNWVRCSQAQTLASNMNSGQYTSSLMFGVQWDLVMKYLETKGAATQDELNSDSTNWGNYANSEYTIANANGKYNAVDLDTGVLTEWLPTTSYSKAVDEVTILTTGASDTFSKQNIYDLAGNMFEWTLEYTSDSSSPCALRAGSCNFYGYDYPASDRYDYNATYSIPDFGFRPSIF